MPGLTIDNTLTFDFDAGVAAQIYDKWQHYANVWNAGAGGKKAVDILAVQTVETQKTAWLIEAKDFRVITNPPKPSNIGGLPQLVMDKVTDTLSGLVDASNRATVLSEKELATEAVSATERRIVLHLEPHVGTHSALFPANFAANVLQSLRGLVNGIDANPLVLNIANTSRAQVPWAVQ